MKNNAYPKGTVLVCTFNDAASINGDYVIVLDSDMIGDNDLTTQLYIYHVRTERKVWVNYKNYARLKGYYIDESRMLW